MDPSDLAAVAMFVKVVELKNFRAAARALKTPRSTVSARVAQLEVNLHLGVPLQVCGDDRPQRLLAGFDRDRDA